jgi:hypothetical protein
MPRREDSVPEWTRSGDVVSELRRLDGAAPKPEELELLRRVAASARGYVNSSTAKVAKYRRVNLENTLREYELAYPSEKVTP